MIKKIAATLMVIASVMVSGVQATQKDVNDMVSLIRGISKDKGNCKFNTVNSGSVNENNIVIASAGMTCDNNINLYVTLLTDRFSGVRYIRYIEFTFIGNDTVYLVKNTVNVDIDNNFIGEITSEL